MVYPLAEKYLRISGKTVEELAEEVGTSRSTMYYKLNGGSDMSVEMAIKVKAALGAEESIEKLFARSDEPEKQEAKRMTLKPEHIVEALNKTPELKRRLILRIMEELLDSEAFMEAYPRLYDPAAAEASPEYREKVREELTQIIVRLFHKNKVRPDDAEEALNRARGTYLEMYVHSDKS